MIAVVLKADLWRSRPSLPITLPLMPRKRSHVMTQLCCGTEVKLAGINYMNITASRFAERGHNNVAPVPGIFFGLFGPSMGRLDV